MTTRFKKRLTNVGDGAATYKVKVEAPKNSTVTISPETLVFRKKYDKNSYSVSIRYRSNGELDSTDGWLTWVEVNGKHMVRSPIVVYPRINSDD
ncbi:hypothetical protein C2S51_007512 [Perilla frutescens var. frutescens]|nr:hypothetical protein C2S51_007512 [Perilla frutescens var. frutescens]